MNETATVATLRQTLVAWSPVLVLVAMSLLLGIGGDDARALARYERGALEAGQWWRLVTGHLVHLGTGHLVLNLAALATIRLLVDDLLSAAEWIGTALAAALVIDAGLYFIGSDIEWYVGLSGVLHGLLAAGALALLGESAALGIGIGIGLVAKLAWEQLAGPLPFSESSTGGPVIVDAHLYGAAGGAAFWMLKRRVRGRETASL